MPLAPYASLRSSQHVREESLHFLGTTKLLGQKGPGPTSFGSTTLRKTKICQNHLTINLV